MILNNILLGILFVIFLIYYCVKRRYEFWSDRRVPFIKPKFPFGNFKGIGTKIHIGLAAANFYNELKGKFQYGGIFLFTVPMALVTDLDLIKNILIKDFNYFMDHGLYSNEKDDPLSYNLFGMDGNRWKSMRSKLTPTFSSGKMRMMFPTMAGVGLELKKCVDCEIENNSEIDIRNIVSRFTTDMIATCAFGIECNSLRDAENMFYKIGRMLFQKPRLSGPSLFCIAAFETLARKLAIKIVPNEATEFFTSIVNDTIASREQSNVKRYDFMSLMIQLKNKGKLEDDSNQDSPNFITTQEIINQTFVFFAAGYESSSTTMSFALNELVANEDIQERLRSEIISVLEKHDRQISYDSLMDMKYLEQVIYGEALLCTIMS